MPGEESSKNLNSKRGPGTMDTFGIEESFETADSKKTAASAKISKRGPSTMSTFGIAESFETAEGKNKK